MTFNRKWFVITMSFILVLSLTPVTAQTQNQAGVVIQYAEGRVATYCVRFDEPSISGLDLLTRAGLSVLGEFSGQGAAVCSINGEGCAYPTQPCFCQCQGADCAYWNYFHLLDDAWRYSPIAVSAYTIENGAIDAWVWGNNDAPSSYSIDQICSAAPIVATNAPVVAATATREPNIEPTVESTALATATVMIEPTATVTQSTVTRAAPSITLEPSPAPQVATATRDTTDAGSYFIVGAIVFVLGGWLVVSRIRK